jgi:thiol-disulfide isomerase/thioredoxin
MLRTRSLVVGAVVLASLSAVARAGEAAFSVSKEAQTRIEGLVAKNGGKVNYFAGPSGTVGVGVSLANGKQMVLYGTPDGRVLFSGVAVDTESGENLTRRDLAAKMPKPDLSGIVKQARAATSITVGSGQAAEFFVFVDPHCPYCHKTYALFEALAKEGPGFTVHYIPIGILGPRSENGAKGLLGMSGEAQASALAGLMAGKAATMSSEAIGAGDKAHQQNLAIFRNLQFDAVPVTVVLSGGEVTVSNGMPPINELREAVAPRKVASR